LLHDPKRIQLLFLPGLGGDRRMAHTQRALPYMLIAPDYIPFERGESLADYAKRFCQRLLVRREIDLERPVFIAGYSLGSAIGQEMTKYIPVRGLILIGGLFSSSELRLIPRLFGRYICRWLPLWVYRAAEMFIAPVMRMVSGLSEQEIQLAGVMYHDLPRGLFREGYRALAKWHGCEITVPFVRIHGESDHIITCQKPGQNIIVILSAKHLVGQSQPAMVNAAIEDFITRTMTGNESKCDGTGDE
jgi:pimeloyl-ACP methyl ester carboxylesterase